MQDPLKKILRKALQDTTCSSKTTNLHKLNVWSL